MVTNLQTQTQETMQGVNILAAAVAEISSTISELAANASETATAVSETSTTMEEVKQTAYLSSKKAQQVAELAQKTSQISQNGRQVTTRSVESMGRIKEQMETITSSIVNLNERNQAISQIIATVNDLADQSNLLAVNAAIEAAKAGEQGKGFAVVAQEIKNLAEQSKRATAQVQAILNDIQKATTNAVIVTEQGGKTVESGVQQSLQAGEVIVSLANSVNEAADAATQIAVSSQQQLIGTDQMVVALESIKQASLQNVDGSRQLESAAHDLNRLGQRLKELVERYQV
jgi:methyl-accepting chemotaxis protein